jgi:8-oxo-dGTP pyrophosphatase MutT (NUDIX family)
VTTPRTILAPEALTPAALAEALGARAHVEHPPLPGRTNHLRCGVLVPIRWTPEPEVLLTRRPTTLKHGGEWCFPGGRPDASDADLYATACREGREELGLTEVTRLGRLASMPIYTSEFRLEPFVVEVHNQTLTPSEAEVAEVRSVPLLEAIERSPIEGIPFQWQGERHYSPVYPLGDRYLFGATAHTFTELVAVAASIVGLSAPKIVTATVTWGAILEATRRELTEPLP